MDDYTQWTHVELLHMKDEVFNTYTNSEAWAKTQFRVRSFKRLRTDCGGEYLSHKFNQHLAANGTKRILTTHDTPAYNGVAERLNRVLLEHTRAFLHSSALPKFLGGEAVKHAVWLKNRTVSYFKIVLSVWTGFFFIFNNFLIILNLVFNLFSELFI